MTELAAQPAPGTGEVLEGRYRLLRLAGAGGMARVYRARDEVLGRDVAIKIMQGAGEADAASRHAAEVTLLASLNHPSLVTLFDARLDADKPYLVMEYIDGVTLTERLDQGALPSAHVAHLAMDVAEGLRVVHGAGIIHRDIKPSNVMLSPAVSPRRPFRTTLTDFGVAYLVDATRLTAPGNVIGTVAYLAPEQLQGGEIGPAVDIYALGLTLIEALTGERVYGSTAAREALLARVSTPPVIGESVPAEWRTLLLRMTAVDPAARPTAAEVAEQAEALLVAPPAVVDEAATVADPVAGAADEVPGVAAPVVPPVVERPVDPPAVETPAGSPRTEAPTRAYTSAAAAPTAATERLAATQGVAAATASRRRRRRRPRAWMLIVGALVVVLAIGIPVAVAASQSSPASSPELPAVDDPLGGHLQDLMDEVSK